MIAELDAVSSADCALDTSLESSGFMENSQEWPKSMVYRLIDFEYLGYSGNRLYLLLQQEEKT